MQSTESDGWTLAQRAQAQIFNISKLRNKIEDGSVGFPEAEPIEPDGPDIPYFIFVEDAFALKTWLMKPYPLKGKDMPDCQLQDL